MEVLYDKPPTEIDNRGIMLEFLRSYGPVFIDLRNRWERGQVNIKKTDGSMERKCGSFLLDQEFRASEETMNTMLERYFDLMNEPALEIEHDRGSN